MKLKVLGFIGLAGLIFLAAAFIPDSRSEIIARSEALVAAEAAGDSLLSTSSFVLPKDETPQLYMVNKFVVKPGKMAEMEEVATTAAEESRNHNFSYPYDGFQTEDLHLFFFYPLDGYAEVEKFYSAAAEWMEKVGMEKMNRLHEKEYSAIENMETMFFRYRPDISYLPEKPRLKNEDLMHFHWAWFYIKPDVQSEFESLMKEFAKLFEQKEIPDSWKLFQGDIGTDSPVYLFSRMAKSPADLWVQTEKDLKVLGKEYEDLFKKTWPLFRNIEITNGYYRPDLSYNPRE